MKINKSLVAIAAALPMQMAYAQDSSLNAQLAISDVSSFDSGLALVLGYEMALPNLPKNLSLEGEFTATIDDPEYRYVVPFSGTVYSAEYSYFTLGGYVKYTLPVSPTFSAYGRAGLSYINESYEGNYVGGVSGNGINLSVGIGANLQISQRMDLTAGFTSIDSHIDHLSAGIKYRL
jgi:hypothetical protein